MRRPKDYLLFGCFLGFGRGLAARWVGKEKSVGIKVLIDACN